MRIFRWALIVCLALILASAIYLTMLGLEIWGGTRDAAARPLGEGEQEIAWIEPATNADDWGRLVSALKQLERDWPTINDEVGALHVNLDLAFPRLSADVPEVALELATAPKQRLLLRWYKVSGEANSHTWINRLRKRERPPLAIIGGATSGRATRMARNLQKHAGDWLGPPPVLLITTATADDDPDTNESIIDLYKGRSFRFSFTNLHMVDAVLAFLAETPDVWVHKTGHLNLLAGAAVVGEASPVPALGILYAAGHLQPMYTVTWEDDSYSRDLSETFVERYKDRQPFGRDVAVGNVAYSVGDFVQPNLSEHATAGLFLAEVARSPIPPRSVLVLPTGAQRMRRFLADLCRRAPLDMRNVVVVNGDAISFHNIYRDRDYAWNIQDVPVPLVFFAHRNPVDHAAGFAWHGSGKGQSPTGTHDLLLFRDIAEAVLYAAFDKGALLDDAGRLRERLLKTCWHQTGAKDPRDNRVRNVLVHGESARTRPLFDDHGNRHEKTGEHIVWLQPSFSGGRLDLVSRIAVYEVNPNGGATWRLVDAGKASYNQSRPEGE